MPDVYASITQADQDLVHQLAEIIELRAADPQKRSMREAYLATIGLQSGFKVLEAGCGTGAVSRSIAERWPEVEIVGTDPSPLLLDHARSCLGKRPR